MNILFITEYFSPYVHGGGEISTQLLAESLGKHGETIHVLTPNYGTASFEDCDGVKIHRYYFLKKLKSFSDQLSPIWHFNPVSILMLLAQIIKTVFVERIQIIHVHGLFSLPAAVLAGKILNIPVIVTFRDSQLLCNYGFCLIKDQFGQACNLRSYFFEDFAAYWQDKVQNKNVFSFVLQLVLAIMGRIRTKALQFFVRQTDIKVVSSFAQQKTFAVNGFKAMVVYNISSFPKKFPASKPTGKMILYATKMSSGKGLDVLLEAFRQVLVEIPDAKLLVVGSGDKKYYERIGKSLNIDKNVDFYPRKSSEEIMKIRQKVLLEVAPPIYPESFGRTALESLVSGVPVVVSNRGGLPEIVESNKTGVVVEPQENELAAGIIRGINGNAVFRKNIKLRYSGLKKKFYEVPINDTIKIYRALCH